MSVLLALHWPPLSDSTWRNHQTHKCTRILVTNLHHGFHLNTGRRMLQNEHIITISYRRNHHDSPSLYFDSLVLYQYSVLLDLSTFDPSFWTFPYLTQSFCTLIAEILEWMAESGTSFGSCFVITDSWCYGTCEPRAFSALIFVGVDPTS